MKVDKLMFTDNSHISWVVSECGVDLLLDTRLKFTGSPSLKYGFTLKLHCSITDMHYEVPFCEEIKSKSISYTKC